MNHSRPFHSSATSTSLLRLAKENDPQGWQTLVREYGLMVYSWCRKAGLSEEDSRDVSQEVFWNLSQNLPEFRRDLPGDSFRKWLKTITNSRIHDHWRAVRRSVSAQGGYTFQNVTHPVTASDEATSDSQVIGHTYNEFLRSMQSKFTTRDWEMFERMVVDGVSADDVAEEFSVSVNVVYLVKSRMVRRLRTAGEKLFAE